MLLPTVLTLGVVTDLHFGPEARFGGTLRKLSHRAGELCAAVARAMREAVQPDLLVQLGDVIEDETADVDRARYREGLAALAEARCELVHVAGNHDAKNLAPTELRAAWGLSREGPLYRSFDRHGVHLVVLHSRERTDVEVTIDPEQLAWLAQDLAGTSLPTVVLMHHSAAEQNLAGNRWFAHAPALCLVRERRELRRILAASGRVRLVLNGHLHWNHFDLCDGIAFVTLQSLVENVEDDAPGRAAAAYAVVRIEPERVGVEVFGAEPCRYQIDGRPGGT